MQKISLEAALEELPTLCVAFTKFAESLELLPLDEMALVVRDRNAQDIMLAAAGFKAAMKSVLEKRVGLH